MAVAIAAAENGSSRSVALTVQLPLYIRRCVWQSELVRPRLLRWFRTNPDLQLKGRLASYPPSA